MASRECPLCGGVVSKKNKHTGAICSSCMNGYKHASAPCKYKDMSPKGMVRGNTVICCRCGSVLLKKADEDIKLAKDAELAEKLDIKQ